MSYLAHPSLDLQIVPRVRDLGGFQVQRVLPSARRKMVGPFIFLDRMGPVLLPPGDGLDVRPHPHIGLATVTYLYDGELLHRDSVGSVQPIRPGDVNWMTAGKGIAHSERTPATLRSAGPSISGLQLWVALPRAVEEGEPGFAHHDRAELPTVTAEGLRVRVVAGSFLGVRSPVALNWETVLADVSMDAGSVLPVSAHHDERALHLIQGRAALGGQPLEAGPLYVLKPGRGRGARGGDTRHAGPARWRAHGWAAPHLVELRLELAGPHRTGARRLDGRPLPASAWRN